MDPRDSAIKRPMAKVHRVGLFRREIRESVSPAALEILLATASRISEGQVARDGRYYGSTMITIDLARVQGHVNDRCDVATADRLRQLLEADAALHQAAEALARGEAERVAGRPLPALSADVRMRAEGTCLFVDVDVEGEVVAVGRGQP